MKELSGRSNMAANYQDYSMITEAATKQESAIQNAVGAATVNRNFPVVLHYLLSEVRKDGQEHIISWQPHGRAFAIHNIGLLEKHILPW